MSFINFNNKTQLTESKYSARMIAEALYSVETKNSIKIKSLIESIKEPVPMSEALKLFSNKLNGMSALNVAKSNSLPVNEGQFSWMTHDTGEQIGSERENRITVYMYDNEGNQWKEDKYDGYGEFGGMDYYELLARMNGYSEQDLENIKGPFKEMRQLGIDLAFGKLKTKDKGRRVLFPALVTDPRYNWRRHDFTQEAENDPNQSWYVEPEYDDYEDDYEDDYYYESKLEEARRSNSDFGFNAKSLRDVKKGDFVWRIMERFNPQLGTYYTADPYKVAKVTGRKVFISSYGDLESYDRDTGIETKSKQPAYGSADYRIVSHQEMLNLAKENPKQFKRNYNTIINFKPEDASNIANESLNEVKLTRGFKFRMYLDGRSDIVDYELVSPNYYNAAKGGKTNLFKVINSTNPKIKIDSTEDFSSDDIKTGFRAGIYTQLKDESLKENTDTFSDYSNNELYAYYKNTKDPKAKEELKKRSQNIKKLTRTDESLNERSINKIQKDWTKITADMKDVVASWKQAEGAEKEKMLAKLKDLTSQKKKLEAELNTAVGLKDADVELVGEANIKTVRNMLFKNKGFKDIVNSENASKIRKAIEDEGLSTKGVSDDELIQIAKELMNESKLDESRMQEIDKKVQKFVIKNANDYGYSNQDSAFQIYLSLKKLYPNLINESLNENFIPKVGTIDDYELKNLYLNNKKFINLLDSAEKEFVKKQDVVVIMHQTKKFNVIFTDGLKEFEVDMKAYELVKPLTTARKEILNFFGRNESLQEKTITVKTADGKLHHYPNSKKQDVIKFLTKNKMNQVNSPNDLKSNMDFYIVESVNKSFSDIENLLIKADIGAVASGGGYGPFVKIGKNTWKNAKTKSLQHSQSLASQIGTFSDFKLDENLQEKTITVKTSHGKLKKGSVVIPYAHDKYGEFIVDKVFKNKDGEISYTGEFKKNGEMREFILHPKDKLVKESVNEYNVNKKFSNKYDIGAGSMGNGTTFWNRAEEEFGDYKKIAHVSDNGVVKFYDKSLPSNVKKHIEDYAKIQKDSANEEISLDESRGLNRNQMMSWLHDHLDFIRTSEELDGSKGGIWVSGEDGDTYKGKIIYDYYSNDTRNYDLGSLITWEKELNKRGWYSEWYDAGTVVIWPE